MIEETAAERPAEHDDGEGGGDRFDEEAPLGADSRPQEGASR